MKAPADRAENYNFFATMFMQLPDDDFVIKLLGLRLPKEMLEQNGASLFQTYIDASVHRPVADVLQELLIDRTQLFRGVVLGGCRPPYESLFVQKPAQVVIGELTELYNSANCKLVANMHESREFLGVELSFMVMLCEKESNASMTHEDAAIYQGLQKKMFEEHLSVWCGKYIEEMLKYVRTDFYRAVAMLFADWLAVEREHFLY